MSPKHHKHTNNEAFTLKVSNETALIGIAIVVIAIIGGTIAFSLIEGWRRFDALYYVAVTISTIGYGDIIPMTHAGKVLTIIYALIGVPLFIFAAGLIIEARLRGFVVSHLHHHQEQINKLKAENQKENQAIEAINEDMEGVSDSIGSVTNNIDEVMNALAQAHHFLKRRQQKK